MDFKSLVIYLSRGANDLAKKLKKRKQKKTLERKRYKGELSFDDQIIPVKFYAWADEKCRLIIKLDALPAAAYVKISTADDSHGRYALGLSLHGQSSDGFSLKSDRVYVSGSKSGTKGHFIFIQPSIAEVTFPLSEPFAEPVARIVLRSFESFRVPPVDTPLGRLVVLGAATVNNQDDVSGSVSLVASNGCFSETWFNRASEFLEHMRQGLSFAHGGRLQMPRIDLYENVTGKSTYYSGSGFASEFPIQHSLHHDPIVQCLVTRFFQKGPLSDHLWDAVSWMQMETTFDEVRFLTGMTAIESMLENILPARKGTTIPKKVFKVLKELLVSVVENFPCIDSDARATFIRLLSGLNRKTFAEKIEGIFDHYEISRRDLEKSVIAEMVKLRNDVVHRGGFSPGIDGWDYIILAREVIVRIVLTELGFKGRYRCYIGGFHDRDFPEPVDYRL